MRDLLASEFYFAIPGDLNSLTGGFIYDKRVIEALQNGIMPVRPLPWPAGFPFPTTSDLTCVAASLAALPDNSVVLIDGLAFGALPALMMAEADRLRLIALVHHPLGYETGLSPDMRRGLIESERRALPAARRIVTTSTTTAQILIADFGVPRRQLTIALPGSDPPLKAYRPQQTDTPTLLSVGAIIPRKGHEFLIEALDRIADLSWQCIIVGSLDRDPQAVAQLRARIAASTVASRIRLAGEIADVQPLYAQADIFVLASHYEGYGMAFAEALRHGLPIIGTTGGAIPEVVPVTAGLLTAPGDASQLAAAMRAVLTDSSLRKSLADGARQAAKALPSWYETASVFASLVHGLD
jgi:glycosyltransferase involved in cell wall biosynthesis